MGFTRPDQRRVELSVDPKTFKSSKLSSSLKILPCQEIFRKKDSEGTKQYRKHLKTKFQGCEQLEVDLVGAGEINNRPQEILGLQIFESYSKGFDVDPTERARFFEKEESEFIIQDGASPKSISTSQIYDFSGPTPKNLKHSLLIKLLNQGFFSFDKKMEAAAFLIHEEMTSGEWFFQFSEKMDFAMFHQYQSKVHKILEQKKTDREKKWNIFWKSLTSKQKNALDLVYMNNSEDRSKEIIAKSLKISLNSLNDRLEGAIKKLKAVFKDEKC